MRSLIGIGAVVAVGVATPASAVVVANSLPYLGTPDWSDVAFSGTEFLLSEGISRLTTAQNRAIYFGRISAAGNLPSWTIANNTLGNYLTLTAAFTTLSDDWNAYLEDGTRTAEMRFNPTNCDTANNNNCYVVDGLIGVNLLFASGNVFVPIDTTQFVTYEMLLRGDDVVYRVNGKRYAGLAATSGTTALLIGDQTGSSRSGSGTMLISAVAFDRATALADLENTVPEPASWAMLVAGFGLAGAVLRRRRQQVFA